MAIALYGATGYTGRLVAAELRRRGLPLLLAGRDEPRLRQASEEHGGGAPVRVARLDDPAALAAALADCTVLLSCAGPFTATGPPLVEAALAAGCHYADVSGEQPWIGRVFDEYGERAAARGVALVPALGFDYAPGDCVARLAAAGHEPVDELVVAYAIEGSGTGEASVRGAVEFEKGSDVVFQDGEWAPAPFGFQRVAFSFPAPLGRQPMQHYASGEAITVPRHTDVRTVRTLVTATTFAPHPRLVPAMPFLRPPAALLLRTPLRRVLARAAAAAPGQVSEGDRDSARFTIAAVARGRNGAAGRALAEGRDFYGLTAAALAAGAQRLAAPQFDRCGALGAAAAFDPAEFLDALGLRWEAA